MNTVNPNLLPAVSFPAKRLKDLVNTMSLVIPSCTVNDIIMVKFDTNGIVFRLCKDDDKLPVFFTVRKEFLLRYEPPIGVMQSWLFQLTFERFQEFVKQAPDHGIVGIYCIKDEIIIIMELISLESDGGNRPDEMSWGAHGFTTDVRPWDYRPDIQHDHSLSVPADEFSSLVAFSTEHHLPVKVILFDTFAILLVEGSSENLSQFIEVSQDQITSTAQIHRQINIPPGLNILYFLPAFILDQYNISSIICRLVLSLYAAPYIQHVSSTATTVKIKFVNPSAEQTVPTVIMMDHGQHADVEFYLNSDSIVQPRLTL